MSALAHRNAIDLKTCGLSDQALVRMSKVNMTVAPSSAQAKLEEMTKDHDKEVLKWKSDIEEYYRKNKILRSMQDIIQTDHRVENVPEDSITPPETEFSTVSNDILWSFRTNSMDKLQVAEKILEDTYEKDLVTNIINEVRDEKSSSNMSTSETVDHLINGLQEPQNFQIIGDNLDLYIPTKHMGSQKQNKDKHYFTVYAVKDDVSGNHLDDDTHVADLSTLAPGDFVPSTSELSALRQNLIVLWSRVLVKKMADFNHLASAAVWHIPHQYSTTMSKASESVILGIINKSENKTEEILEIMDSLHHDYVPKVSEINGKGVLQTKVVQPIVFGGDQLTAERCRNAKLARSDGDTPEDIIQGLEPKFEDWHGIRNVFEIAMKILRKESASDVGTLCANANITKNTNAKKSVVEAYTEVKGFFNLNVDAHIVSATMQELGMKSENDNVIPDSVKYNSAQVKRDWLHTTVSSLVDKFIMGSVTSTLLEARHVEVLSGKGDISCPVCSKDYKYRACLKKHLKTCHPEFDEKSDACSSSNKTEKDDGIFNYGCLVLTLGLIIRNADDAVKEGDGERLLNFWIVVLPLLKLFNHHKYALEALTLQAQVKALLSPRRAHQLIWNRTVSDKGGKGKRKSRDLKNEHINNIAKEALRGCGFQNISKDESIVVKVGKTLTGRSKIEEQHSEDLGMSKKGYYKADTRDNDFRLILNEIHKKANVFELIPGRAHHCFQGLSRNMFSGLDLTLFHKWIIGHLQGWKAVYQQ